MDVEANKALVRRFYEDVWQRGDVRFAEEVSRTTTSDTTFARRKQRRVARARR